VHVLAHRGERREDAIEIGVLARQRGDGGDLGFDQAARPQQLERPRVAQNLKSDALGKHSINFLTSAAV